MKLILIFAAIILAINAKNPDILKNCYNEAEKDCPKNSITISGSKCNADYSGIKYNIKSLHNYTNQQIGYSYVYLKLASRFSNFQVNRPGFYKVFRELSDKAWSNSIDLIKFMTKRGQTHNFNGLADNNLIQSDQTIDITEVYALGLVLDMEKQLANEAHNLHESYSHANNKTKYDPSVAHYLEEKFIEYQSDTIRKLAGYAMDLKKLLTESNDGSLAVYLFDEYLQSQ